MAAGKMRARDVLFLVWQMVVALTGYPHLSKAKTFIAQNINYVYGE